MNQIVGRAPFKFGEKLNTPNHHGADGVAARPRNVKKEDHVVLKRCDTAAESKENEKMMQYLADDFNMEELTKLIIYMQMHISGTAITEENKEILQEVQQLHPQNDQDPDTIGSRVIKAWSHEIFNKSSCMTRTFHYQDGLKVKRSDVGPPVLGAMYHELEIEDLDVTVDYVVILDDDYYILFNNVCLALNYPNTCLDYVGISAALEKITKFDEEEVEVIVAKKDYKVSVMKYTQSGRDTAQYRLKLVTISPTLFNDMVINLYLTFNSTAFLDWTESKGYNLWKGRREHAKRENYRKKDRMCRDVKDRLQLVQGEVDALRRKVAEAEDEDEDEESNDDMNEDVI